MIKRYLKMLKNRLKPNNPDHIPDPASVTCNRIFKRFKQIRLLHCDSRLTHYDKPAEVGYNNYCLITTAGCTHIKLWLYLLSLLGYSMSKNVVTLKSGSEVAQGYWKWCHSIDCIWLVYGIWSLVFFSNFVPKTHRFWEIRLVSIQWSWNPG